MIYRLDEMIANALESFYDTDTGEVLEGITDEDMANKIAELAADFDLKIDNIASEIKNLKAEAMDIKEEKIRLAKRQSAVEKRLERTKRLLAYLLAGEKWKNGKHNISYRKSDKLVMDDEAELLEWCKVSGRGFLKEPEMMLGDIKLAIRRGDNIPFVHLEDQNNIIIR